MEIIKKTKEVANKYTQMRDVLIRLDEAIKCYDKHIDLEELCLRRLIRDGLIQNYEFTIEIFWKFLFTILRSQGIVINSVTGINTFKEAENQRFISKDEYNQLTQLIVDRNESSHTYLEPLAIEIADRIPAHYQVMKKIFDRIEI